MSKHSYFAGIDTGYGDDKTVMAYFRQRRLRWWERLLTKLFKHYEIKQPLELVDTFELVSHRKDKS